MADVLVVASIVKMFLRLMMLAICSTARYKYGVHTALCWGQFWTWHLREQYRTFLHRAHFRKLSPKLAHVLHVSPDCISRWSSTISIKVVRHERLEFGRISSRARGVELDCCLWAPYFMLAIVNTYTFAHTQTHDIIWWSFDGARSVCVYIYVCACVLTLRNCFFQGS